MEMKVPGRAHDPCTQVASGLQEGSNTRPVLSLSLGNRGDQGVAQLLECLPSLQRALSSVPFSK